jgi:hypothetical protein
MTSHNDDRSRSLSEEDARRLLARAVELESRESVYVSLDELRIVAREAGIDDVAFEKALEEFHTGALRPPTIGRLISERMGRVRRFSYACGFLGAALVTPGDAVLLSIAAGFGLCGVYEGIIAVARLFGGYSPPPVPPQSQTVKTDSGPRPSSMDQTDMRFIAARGRLIALLWLSQPRYVT